LRRKKSISNLILIRIFIITIPLISFVSARGGILQSEQKSPIIKKARPFVDKSNERLINSLKELMQEMIGKIDWDIDITAAAFADAQNIQRSMRWADIFGAGLNIVTGTIDNISSLVTLKDLSQGLTDEFLKYEHPLEAFSGLLTVESLIESGKRLQLVIDGPSYSSGVKKMLDEAYRQSSTWLKFNYEAYRTTIKRYLQGFYDFTPVIVAHRSSDISRKNIGIVCGADRVERAIRKRFRGLIEELERNSVPNELERDMIERINRVRKSILRSRMHGTKINYKTYLGDGERHVPVEPEMWLGNISELERVRIEALTDFGKRLKREEILTINKMVKGILGATTIYLNINYPSSKIGKSLGRISKVFILPPGVDLSERIMKTSVYQTDPREQVNMIPQEMVLALTKELSDHDLLRYLKYQSLKKVEEEIKSLKSNLDDLEKIVANRKELSTILRNIQQIAIDSKLDIKKFTVLGENTKGFYSEWPIKLEIIGNYFYFLNFFNQLSEYPKLINIENISSEYNYIDFENNSEFTISFIIKIFCFSEEGIKKENQTNARFLKLDQIKKNKRLLEEKINLVQILKRKQKRILDYFKNAILKILGKKIQKDLGNLKRINLSKDIPSCIQILDVETKWVAKYYQPWPPKLILVPSISFRVKNLTDKPLHYLNFNANFRFKDDYENLGDCFLAAIRGKPIMPGEVSNQILLKSNYGVEGKSLRSFHNNPNWKLVIVKLFVQSKGSQYVFLGEWEISRKIDFREPKL